MSTLVLVLTFLITAITALLLLVPGGEAALVKQRAAAIRRQTAGRVERRRVVDEELALPFYQRVIVPVLDRAAKLVSRGSSAKAQSALQQKLQQAGQPTNPSRFLGQQVLGAAGAGLVGLLLTAASDKPALGLLMALLLAGLGWRLPDFMLSRRVSERREKIDRALPDVLDLLSVSVEAGLGLDGAIQKVGEKFPEPTAGEFRELLKQIRLGAPRADALRAMADRSGVPDMRTFTAAVIQAEQLGVSISRVLKAQSEALRLKRKQKMQEKAMQLPVKLLFPLLFFIFPTIFIVVLGPVVISILQNFVGR